MFSWFGFSFEFFTQNNSEFYFHFVVNPSFISFFQFLSFQSSKTSRFFLSFFASCHSAIVTAPSSPPVTSTVHSRFPSLATHRWPF